MSAPRLAQRHVIVTRPLEDSTAEGQALSLEAQLAAWGARVSHIPLITVACQPFESLDPAAFDWLFLTSRNAARCFYAEALRTHEAWQNLPAVVVGPVTGQAVRALGIEPAFVAPRFDALSAAQAFAEGPARPGLRMLWPCGNRAQSGWIEILKPQGVQVTAVEVYQTHLRTALTAAETATFQNGADVLVFTSPSAIQAFQALGLPVGEATIACLGPRTGQAAVHAFGRVDVQAEPYTLEGMAQALYQHYAGEAPGC